MNVTPDHLEKIRIVHLICAIFHMCNESYSNICQYYAISDYNVDTLHCIIDTGPKGIVKLWVVQPIICQFTEMTTAS